MEKTKISELNLGETVDIFLMINSIEDKETTNNKPYIEFEFGDGEQKIGGKMWDAKISGLPEGVIAREVIKVRAKVVEWNNGLQLRVDKCRTLMPQDNISKDDFIRKAPIDPEEMFNYIINVVNNFNNQDLMVLTSAILTNYKDKLLYFAGGKTVHHDIKSGLLYHMLRMLQTGMKTAEVYEGINKDLFFTGIILHDIGKVEELGSDECGIVDDYTKPGKLLGHLVQGIKIVSFTCKELNISEEVSLVIEHMIASHHGDPSTGALTKPAFLEAELLHLMDMIDARVYMFNEINDTLEPDTFSDRKFFLGNVQVYKHNL